MMGSRRIFVSVFFILCTFSWHFSLAERIKLRIVTWNVANNGRMGYIPGSQTTTDGFTDAAIDHVLGLNDESNILPSVYAIGLQENCWKCNKDNMHEIAKRFVNRINKKEGKAEYVSIGVEGTRVNNKCEMKYMCNLLHGTTALVVIKKKSLVTKHEAFHINKCHAGVMYPFAGGKLYKNSEKGIAAMKVIFENEKRTLCFGTGHLDPSVPRVRRECLKNFFDKANKDFNWLDACDGEFLFGDFNTRTGGKIKGASSATGEYVHVDTNFADLKSRDELTGKDAFGKGDTGMNLLEYINSIQKSISNQKSVFHEGPLNFMPTYKIEESKKKCNGNFPCYKRTRPKSWTDRIIYSLKAQIGINSKFINYNAIMNEEHGDDFPMYGEINYNAILSDEYGDHFPVYGEFEVPSA